MFSNLLDHDELDSQSFEEVSLDLQLDQYSPIKYKEVSQASQQAPDNPINRDTDLHVGSQIRQSSSAISSSSSQEDQISFDS